MANQFNLSIRPNAINFIQLTGNRLFEVPIYQRTYNWRLEEIETFYNDIVDLSNDYNFFGIIILKDLTSGKGQKNARYEVIDGQQRLTTFFIFLKAIEIVLQQILLAKKSIKCDKLIKDVRGEFWRDSKISFCPTYRDKKDFEEIINIRFEGQKTRNTIKTNSKISNFFFALDYFVNRLSEFDVNKLDKIFRETLADNYFIEVITKDVSNVYDLFKSLNAKGLELALEDLLKNELYNGLKKIKAKAQVINETIAAWDDTINMMRSINGFTIDNFLFYYINSREDLIKIKAYLPGLKNKNDFSPIPKKYLFKAYEVIINKTSNAQKLTADLKKNYPSIKEILLPDNDLTKIEFYSYSLLNALNVSKGISAIIAAKNKFNSKEFLKILQGIELTCVRHSFTNIDQKALEIIFSNTIKEIHNKDIVAVKSELLKADCWRNQDLVEQGFINYGKMNNKISKHFLLRIFVDDIYTHYSGNWEYDQLQLEHIMPKSPKNNGAFGKMQSRNNREYSDYCGMIGNHILLSEKLNKRITNSDFNEKRNGYKSTNGKLIPGYKGKTLSPFNFINKKKVWNYEEIKERQKVLGMLLLNLDF
jgi:uncharacterized protein with ParB-like and HNH nuclease domain